jgi:hypothetical protein
MTFTEGASIVVVRAVPAEICDSCGSEYTDEETTDRLLAIAAEPCARGAQVEVREYTAA